MKQATLIFALLGAMVLAGCGNGDTTSQTTFNNGSGDQPFKPTTHLSHRSLVTNYYAGDLQVMDATQDRLTTYHLCHRRPADLHAVFARWYLDPRQ